MTTSNETASVRRVTAMGTRKATILDTDDTRVMVDDAGGMVSELSTRKGAGYVNAHWVPLFRSNSGEVFSEAKHGSFWKAKLLYQIAGSFPCAPNFGPGHEVEGVVLPPHGWTANEEWRYEKSGVDRESGAAWALSRMESPDEALPLSFRKIDALVFGEGVHYMSLSVENRGDREADINIGWHNTVGAPFLEAGCRVSACAETWATVPDGSEFDDTGRLEKGAEFASLDRAPTRTGGICDLSTVPGPIGFTDFATGAVPRRASLGWSAVVNPAQGFVYACVFPGPAAVGEDDIALSFNDLWMQYGGRRFTPWAAYEGGTDLAYCLGTEQAVGAYANGLAYAKKKTKLLGSPTTVSIPGRSTRTLRYGTLFTPFADGTLDGGVATIDGEVDALVLSGAKGFHRFRADPGFLTLRALERIAFS